METKEHINSELLHKTFFTLEGIMDRWKDSDLERIEAIYKLLQGNFERAFIKKAYTILNSEYMILPDRNIEKLKQRVAIHFGELNEEQATKILSLMVFGVENALENGGEDDLLSRQIRLNHGLSENTSLGSEIENAEGKFGFSIGNPIPINGIDNINNYFAKLRLITGESITCKRLGSKPSDSLPFPVDEYEVYNADKKIVATLYIYAYHGQNSTQVPEGFKMLGT